MMIKVRLVCPNLSLITVNLLPATLTNEMPYQMQLCHKIFSTSCLVRKQESLFVIQLENNIMHVIVPLNT